MPYFFVGSYYKPEWELYYRGPTKEEGVVVQETQA